MHWLAGVESGAREDLLDAWAAALDSAEKLGHLPEQARVRAGIQEDVFPYPEDVRFPR